MSYSLYFSIAALIVVAPHAPRSLALVAGWAAILLSLGSSLGWWLK